MSHVIGSYVKHHLKPKLEERKLLHQKLQDNVATTTVGADDDAPVPDERKKGELKKLRHLFKGHKISEPNFGDRVKTSASKVSQKSLNRSCDK